MTYPSEDSTCGPSTRPPMAASGNERGDCRPAIYEKAQTACLSEHGASIMRGTFPGSRPCAFPSYLEETGCTNSFG
jgi:hypothetical protein